MADCSEWAFFALKVPPVGIVQILTDELIEWAPGNGLAYRMIATPLPRATAEKVGGTIVISIRQPIGNEFTTYISNPKNGGVYTLDFVEEKFKEQRDSLYYVTALLNWAIYGKDSWAGKYAMTLFEEARLKWV